jgi:hypothetical protein
MDIPFYINKKNKFSKYYFDSKNNKWIYKDNLNVYILGLKTNRTIDRDKKIRKSRYDLKY